MDHVRALELYEAYFKGSLDRATVKEFHAHLNDCEDCKVRLRTTRVSAGRGVRRGSEGAQDDSMKRILSRNRTMTYVVIVIMICFFLLLKLRLFQPV